MTRQASAITPRRIKAGRAATGRNAAQTVGSISAPAQATVQPIPHGRAATGTILPRLRTAYELRRQSQLQLRKLDVLQQLPAQPDGNLYLLRYDDYLLRLPFNQHEVFAVQLNSAQLRQLLLHLWFVCRFCQLCQSQPQLWKLAELLRYSAQTDGKLFHLRIQHL